MLRTRAHPFWPSVSLALTSLLLTACGGGGGAASSPSAVSPPALAEGDPRGVSGTATNVNGTGLVLQINGGNDISIPAGTAQGFSFSTLPEGIEYRISIKSQPSGQACTLLRGAGIIGAADITDVTLDCTDNVTDSLAGTYVVVSDEVRDFVTFSADGTFVVGTHEDDPDCGANNGNGVEYGVYNWDAATGNFFVVNTTLDTNGVCGLFDENNPEASAGLLLRSLDGSLSLINKQNSGGAERFLLQPVASVPATLIGSFGVAGAPDFAVLLSDGTYFVTTTQEDPVSATTVGIEDACYETGSSPGAASGTFATDNETCTLAFPLTPIDTNGTAGFSSSQATPYTVVNANTLTFSDQAGASTVTRIAANDVGIPDRNNVLAGTYFSDLGVAGNRTYITFYADSTFVYGSIENDPDCGTTLGNGVEYGVYQWDRASGAFRVLSVAVDTNGVCGADGLQGTLVKSSNGFTFTDDTDGVQTAFTAVLPVLENPLIGSSTLASRIASRVNGPDFVVFTNDGRYFQANPSSDEVDSQFVAGVEDGCYTDNGSTLVLDLGGGCTGAIDTNGTAGLSSVAGSTVPYQITGADTLRFFLGQLELNDLQFTRMFPNSLDPLTGTYAIAGKRAFITFYDDGAFAVGAHNSDPRLSQDIPDDVEFGVYSWNQATSEFLLLARTLDTNSDSGALNTPELLTRAPDGALIVTTEVGQDFFVPVESSADALIGSFFFNNDSSRSIVVFASDGSYFLMDLSVDSESRTIGIEDGCYAATPDSPVSGSLTPSATRCLSVGDGLGTLDTNGLQGFPDASTIFYLRLDPKTLQLVIDFDRVIIGV